MLTAKEFNKLVKEHNRLMKLCNEQTNIMHEINNGNPFMFLWNVIVTKKFAKARALAEQYIQEGRDLLKQL